MQAHEDPGTRVKILRFSDFKRQEAEFVARVLATNALLSFRIAPGYMLNAEPGDTVTLRAFGSVSGPASANRGPSFVPMQCTPDPLYLKLHPPVPAVGQKRVRLL